MTDVSPVSSDGVFEVWIKPAREVVYVVPAGELDLATTPELQERIEELFAVGFAHVVLNLRQLTFCDASGVGLLISLNTAAKRGGRRLSVIQGPPVIRRIFTLTATLELLPFTSPNKLVRLITNETN